MPDCLIRYAVILFDVTAWVFLLAPLEHGCPYPGRDLEAEDQGQCEGAVRKRYRQPLDKAEVKRSAKGESGIDFSCNNHALSDTCNHPSSML
jgi:hypothetical protein